MAEEALPTKYYVGIRFLGSEKAYYFSTEFSDLKLGDMVVVDTVNGYEMGTVTTPLMNLANYHGQLALKPVLRKPTRSDMVDYNFNLKEAERALAITAEHIKALNLPMDLIDAYYTLDGTKVTITYTSPEKRVDFRELLRKIAPALSCRVELRQIASRDKAKMVGGLGTCGLPLCCSTFLTQFEGISIGKAKNQMLTLNIPKLSGACGKLICCLAYEDDTYTIEKKEFPHIGEVIHTPDGDYTVDSMNIISRTIRLANAERSDYQTYSLEDVKAMIAGTYQKREDSKPLENFTLPDFNIVATGVRENSYGGNSLGTPAAQPEQPNNQGGGNRNRHRNRHRGNNKGGQQGQQKPNNGGQPQQGPSNGQQKPRQQGGGRPEEGGENRRNRHRHYHHNNRGGNRGGQGQQG